MSWGVNWYGQIGDSTHDDQAVAVPVKDLSSGVEAITAEYYSRHSAAPAWGTGFWHDRLVRKPQHHGRNRQALWLTRVKSISRLGAPWGRVPWRWRKLHPHLQDATAPCAQSSSIDAIAMRVEQGHCFGVTAIVAEEQSLSLATRSRNLMGIMRTWLKYSHRKIHDVRACSLPTRLLGSLLMDHAVPAGISRRG